MPLVKDDEDYPQEEAQTEQDPVEQLGQKTVQTGVSFKNLLSSFGSWLSKRKLPDSARQGLKEFGQEIWYSKEDLAKRRRGGNKATQKWTGTPFKSFGPQREKKKGKL